MIGTPVSHYRILERLGGGGMGLRESQQGAASRKGTPPCGPEPSGGGQWRAPTRIVLAGVAVIAVIAGAVWFRFFRPAPKVAGPPMRIVPFANYPGHQEYASFSPDGSRIAFVWDGDKEYNWHICVKLISTEKSLRLTTGPAQDDTPRWSPDGRYIAFRRHSEREDGIYVVPAVGGPERRLHTPSLGGLWSFEFFDWSPDGKYLVYVDGRPNLQVATLFLLAVDNPEDIRPLTTSAGLTADLYPRFSPDGQTVAFVREGANDIFLVRLAGGEPKRLTFDNAVIHGLDWTPDGAYIIFSSDRLGSEGRLCKVSVSGGQVETLPVGQRGTYAPSLSRHGHRLAYTHWDPNMSIWRYGVPRMTGQSAPPTKLFTSIGLDPIPQYSPDGKRIAFQSSRSGTEEIWVCDSAGSNPRQLTFFNGPRVGVPRWSPDGREIVFQAAPEGDAAIYVVSAEGGRPRRLTTDAPYAFAPSWSRDGRWIYFSSASDVWKMPADGGHAVQVTKKGGEEPFEAPDGKTLYYVKSFDVRGLWKVPVAGGEETVVFKQFPVGHFDWWGLTGEGIYFYNEATRSVDFLSFATHKVAQIFKRNKALLPRIPSLAVSPDGRWILLDQSDEDIIKIMLVENFRW